MMETAQQLVAACLDAAQNRKTLYVRSCFGAPMNETNKRRYAKADPQAAAAIAAASADTFGFDCVCFVKGLLWGWKADPGQIYGGAEYLAGGIPDLSADQLLSRCLEVSEDFSTIQPGEYVWLPGHCGIYVGDGLAAEATSEPKSGVQLQAVLPMGGKAGYPATGWVKHGKLPWLRYDTGQSFRVTLEGVTAPELEKLRLQAAQAGWQLQAAPAQPKPQPPEQPAQPEQPEVGQLLHFRGGLHYASANATEGVWRPAGPARLTKVKPGARHPYHLIKTGQTGPYGWVDGDTLEKQ